MTFGKLQQIEAAKAALPLAMEPLQGLARYEARRLVTTAAPVLVERVIELEIQLTVIRKECASRITDKLLSEIRDAVIQEPCEGQVQIGFLLTDEAAIAKLRTAIEGE